MVSKLPCPVSGEIRREAISTWSSREMKQQLEPRAAGSPAVIGPGARSGLGHGEEQMKEMLWLWKMYPKKSPRNR